MRLRTCPRCGDPSSGFMKLCGRCEHTVTLLSEPKGKKRVIDEPDDDDE